MFRLTSATLIVVLLTLVAFAQTALAGPVPLSEPDVTGTGSGSGSTAGNPTDGISSGDVLQVGVALALLAVVILIGMSTTVHQRHQHAVTTP